MKYQVLISDVRVFKRVIEAEDKAAADEAAQALLDNGYSEASAVNYTRRVMPR